MEFNRILAPTDLSAPSFQALRQAMTLAKNNEAELILLLVLPAAQTGDSEFNDAQRHLDELLRNYAPPGLTASTLVRRGDVVGEILSVAQTGNLDLIIMSTHGTGGWREFVLGSITGEVVRTAPCPVLTIGNAARK